MSRAASSAATASSPVASTVPGVASNRSSASLRVWSNDGRGVADQAASASTSTGSSPLRAGTTARPASSPSATLVTVPTSAPPLQVVAVGQTPPGAVVRGTASAAVVSPAASRRSATSRASPAATARSADVATTALDRNGTAAAAAPSSSSTTAASRAEAPAPSSASGTSRPASPRSPARAAQSGRSCGASPSSERICTAGSSRSRRTARSVARRSVSTSRSSRSASASASAATPGSRASARSAWVVTGGSSSRQVLPGGGGVGAGLGGQPEHPLGDDVAQDLGGAALDGVALGPQVAVAGTPTGEVDALGTAHRPVVVRQALLGAKLHLEATGRLREPGERELVRGPFRAGLTRGELLAQPLTRDPVDLGVDPEREQPVVQLGGAQVGPLAPQRRAHPDHAALPRGGRAADGDALVHQGRLRDLPPGAHRPQPLRVGDAYPGQPDLVELGLARDLPQRPDLDAGCGHVADEVRQPGVLHDARVVAGDEDRPPRRVRVRRPHLLAVDDPVVAVRLQDGTGGQTREVGTGAGLAEELAPDLFTRPERAQPALLLLGRAEGEDGRRGHAEADPDAAGVVVGRAGPGQLGVDDALQAARRPEPAQTLGVVHPGQPGIEAGPQERGRRGRGGIVRGDQFADPPPDLPGIGHERTLRHTCDIAALPGGQS